ncbi:hypothetical protein AAG570_006427 [Ranatra chinensis]|uniref:Small ribosomal subunit protein uS10 domain-containing protein n=1 Tax=Ranatra chinensis TaxID=642074 RepID=A0ABD0YTY7_9HEMI
MKSYDFALLESYQRLVYKIAKMLDICVEDGWATPAKQTKVQRFKPNSTVVDSEYILNTYERNIQISELPSNIAPIFIELIQAGLPKSITLRVHKHEEEFEKIRYVPDLELKELKTQLDTLGGPVKKK